MGGLGETWFEDGGSPKTNQVKLTGPSRETELLSASQPMKPTVSTKVAI
jgi:hypothetical protein